MVPRAASGTPLAPPHHQFQATSTLPEIDAEFQKWPPGERHRPRHQILPLRRGRRKEEFSPLSVVVREHLNDETLFRCLLVVDKLHAALL
ncbi:hypothetical protein EJB05_20293 [Eragrostis curvula]|uniref:Uncharacterized protein n=2 Tax=Eragrostis curvula TaxID=38414 RepID=A0A5J9V0D1_9POAL|nr:hypothetical protein EJB05_20293 [Eragrostis curvula]